MEVLILVILLPLISLSTSDTFSVKIGVENYVNEVDSRFLSFTVDPKYVFSTTEKYKSKECICMATSLTPAYIRIAGPSTSSMTFQNSTITIKELDEDKYQDSKSQGTIAVGHRKWRKFVQWAKTSGFDIVFALNNEEKTSSGMWDPNTALNILTVAEKANIDEIFWQLGYECNHQSIEEYLNDLETLRVIIETFAPGRRGGWRLVGGDVSNCLHADSKSDFKDYVTLSDDMMDAIMLNGNSSSQELIRMSDVDRLKLLKRLSESSTPLWLTESSRSGDNEVERAADWLSSLGYSARNGFSIHFRELLEEEMYEPTLSFYMALLFKNLVGERVLDVQLDAEQSVLFAHCTSLRHKVVPGAVTIYGANMDDEIARFSIKMNQKEEGGEIMQFIIGQDHNGNVVVNGRPMNHEGDINPVVKRVRPYKTLLINLPPKSFGFWVLANTNIEACQYTDQSKNTSESTELSASDESVEVIRRKRLVLYGKENENKDININKIIKSGKNLSNFSYPGVDIKLKIEDNIEKEGSSVNDFEKNNCNFVKYMDSFINDEECKKTVQSEIRNSSNQLENELISDILDLDRVTEFKISALDNKLDKKVEGLKDDIYRTTNIFKTNKRKRNTDENGTADAESDNAASTSIKHGSKSKRLDGRPKRRQSVTEPKAKRFENAKSYKLRSYDDNEPSKLEKLRSKLFKTDRYLEGKSNILETILAKRNARLKNERRKLRFGKNFEERNQRIKKSESNRNLKDEKKTRIRRSIIDNVPGTFNFMNKLNEINKTDILSRVIRNTVKEFQSNKDVQRSAKEEKMYLKHNDISKSDDVKIKTLRSSRNKPKQARSRENGEKILTSSQGSEIENSEEEISVQNNERKTEKEPINKFNRSGRSAIDKRKLEFENEIENDIDNTKLWKILRKIHNQLKDLSSEKDTVYDIDESIDDEQNVSKEDSGLIKSTVNNLLKVLRELNKNLSRFWGSVNFLD